MAKSEKVSGDQFSSAETKARMEAALRGARITGHKTIDQVRKNPKRPKPRKSAPKAV